MSFAFPVHIEPETNSHERTAETECRVELRSHSIWSDDKDHWSGWENMASRTISDRELRRLTWCMLQKLLQDHPA